ncbi:hypothetical protein HJA_02825 [Hyphomonas jannaschiana VP2]|uniref:Uncharacterized protein n=1 Tax=Hyphomonas jannaschiana VP2 TaxID=1280952 RepID=A0A059FLF2_9PROT|nr:hypothetical protein HJA_02825 [Hyphomonas jannaschiana VP2]
MFLGAWLQQDGVAKVLDKFSPRVIPGRAAVWGSISERCLGRVTRMTYLLLLSEMGTRMAVGHRA